MTEPARVRRVEWDFLNDRAYITEVKQEHQDAPKPVVSDPSSGGSES